MDGTSGVWFSGASTSGGWELYGPVEDLELTGLVWSHGAYIPFAGLTLGRRDICLEIDYSAKNAGDHEWVASLGIL